MERTSTTILPTRQQNLLMGPTGERSDEVVLGLSPASHRRDFQNGHRSLVIQVSPVLRPMNFGRTIPRHKRVGLVRKDFKLNLRQSFKSFVPPGASLVAHGHPSSTRPEHATPHSPQYNVAFCSKSFSSTSLLLLHTSHRCHRKQPSDGLATSHVHTAQRGGHATSQRIQ